MADENLPLNKKWVYLYNKDETTHPYTGKLMVDKDSPLMPGQTIFEPKAGGQQYFNEATNQWVNQVVLTYEIKTDKSLGQITRRPAGYTPATNETLVKPADGLYDPTWNGSAWVGISEEEYYKKHPIEPAKPSQSQQLLANLMKDVAAVKVDSKTQDTLNASVMKELASQKLEQAKVNATILKQLAAIKTTNTATA